MFALRGSGASFGLVTEFLYKIYPEPEPLPVFLLVWMEDIQDMVNIQEAAFHPASPYNSS